MICSDEPTVAWLRWGCCCCFCCWNCIIFCVVWIGIAKRIVTTFSYSEQPRKIARFALGKRSNECGMVLWGSWNPLNHLIVWNLTVCTLQRLYGLNQWKREGVFACCNPTIKYSCSWGVLCRAIESYYSNSSPARISTAIVWLEAFQGRLWVNDLF